MKKKTSTEKYSKHRINITNPDKIFFQKDKITKLDVIEYYQKIAPIMIKYTKDRPLSMLRYPNGINEDYFFQKNAAESFPDWIVTETIPSEEREINYVIANDKQTLLYLTNLGCIDQNPWMSRVGSDMPILQPPPI